MGWAESLSRAAGVSSLSQFHDALARAQAGKSLILMATEVESMTTALILLLFGSLKGLLTGEPQGAGFEQRKPETHSNVRQDEEEYVRRGPPRQPCCLWSQAPSGQASSPLHPSWLSQHQNLWPHLSCLPIPSSIHRKKCFVFPALCLQIHCTLCQRGASLV